MQNLLKFTKKNLSRFNAIIDSYNSTQISHINLLACVSYSFPEAAQAMQYPLYTLPTEGVVNSRYFPVSAYMDEIENIAEDLILKLFKITSGYRANTQPHSGTQANHIVYNSILKSDDKVLSLKTNNGGHISHSKIFNNNMEIVYYGLTDENEINYDHMAEIAQEHKPKLIISGGSSYPRRINFKKITEIARSCGAYVLADISHTALFIAGGVHDDIFPYVDFATFTMEKNLRGPHGGVVVYRENLHRKICASIFPHSQGSPIQNLMFGKVVALQLLCDMDIKGYATKVVENARKIAHVLQEKGVEVITGGTDSHIVLINVARHGETGKEIEKIMGENHILVNRNLIPGDAASPLVTSGIRIGSTPITNLNYKPEDVIELANLLASLVTEKRCDVKSRDQLVRKYSSTLNISNWERELERFS